jgi:hypothetical protein
MWGRGFVAPLSIVSMGTVLSAVLRRAEEAGIELRRFTAEPGNMADETALNAEIAEHQRRALERLGRKGARWQTPSRARTTAEGNSTS